MFSCGISGQIHAWEAALIAFTLSDGSVYYKPVEEATSEASTIGATSAMPVAIFASGGAALAVSAAGSVLAFMFTILTDPIDWHTSRTDPLFGSNLAREDILVHVQGIKRNASKYLDGAQVGEEFYELIDFMDDYPNLEGLSNEAKAQLILGLDSEQINKLIDEIP